MVRRNPGFVAKRPHSKSRRGCLACKKKKVKVRYETKAERKAERVKLGMKKKK